jgi:xylulokinase
MLFDMRRRDWSQELLGLAGLPPELMPPAFPSGQVVGIVSGEAARQTGLPQGLPVAAGGHDHICAALAVGAITTDVVLDSAGTAESLDRHFGTVLRLPYRP